jgi:hypothetical protein
LKAPNESLDRTVPDLSRFSMQADAPRNSDSGG